MNLAGVMEFILGNTFPMVVFIVYGCHWINVGYTMDPAHALAASYDTNNQANGGLNQEFLAGQGHYNVIMCIITFCFLCGSLRTNGPFVITFFTIVFLFAFFAAGYYSLGYNPSVAGQEHAALMFKIAGGFGFVAMIMGWYLALITACASSKFSLSACGLLMGCRFANLHSSWCSMSSSRLRSFWKGLCSL